MLVLTLTMARILKERFKITQFTCMLGLSKDAFENWKWWLFPRRGTGWLGQKGQGDSSLWTLRTSNILYHMHGLAI